MKKYLHSIIVDDELECIDNLEYHLIKFCPAIKIDYKTSSIQNALAFLEKEKVDIAFMDIEIYDDNIFNVINRIEKINFEIVFVTAYESYAIKAFKVDALDYILKPIDKQDIINCYSKIQRHFLGNEKTTDLSTESQINQKIEEPNKKIILRDSEKIYVIQHHNVLYLKANGSYTTICFDYQGEDKFVTLSKSILQVEQEYDLQNLYRVHKSYSINLKRVKEIIKNDTIFLKLDNNVLIPVAKRKVNDVLSLINIPNA